MMKSFYFFKPVVLIGLFALVSDIGFSMVKLPSIISDNMVLQRNATVKLWGTSDKGTRIAVTTSWDHKKHFTSTNKKGAWIIEVETPEAGGPYKIIFDDGDELEIQNIMIGEVWLCSGQSNMARTMAGATNQPILNSNLILTHARNQNLRLYKVKKLASDTLVNDTKGVWNSSDPGVAYNFSAVGFQFGLMLQEALEVPVGIIESDWGGTPIEAWMNQKSLIGFPDINSNNPFYNVKKARKNGASFLFNGMIYPLTQFGIKGVLWYQGEWNSRNPSIYKRLMTLMVKGWRDQWGIGNFPFYYVQIAPYEYDINIRDSVPFVREAQLLASKEIPNSGMVVSMDVGEKNSIHFADKTTIAQRLLFWALGHTYRWEGISYKSPEYKEMKIKGNKVEISFYNAKRGLTSFNHKISGFELSGVDKKFYPAKADILKNGSIILESEDVENPVAARYLFASWAEGNLYNLAGLPVGPFRSDNW